MRGLILLAVIWSSLALNTLAAEDHDHDHAHAPAPAASTATVDQAFKKLKLAPGATAIFVSDIHCATCAKKIAGKLYAIKGVKKVETNVKTKLAVIQSQQKTPLDPLAAWKAVQSAGFQPARLVGPAGTYVPSEDKNEKAPVKLGSKTVKQTTFAR